MARTRNPGRPARLRRYLTALKDQFQSTHSEPNQQIEPAKPAFGLGLGESMQGLWRLLGSASQAVRGDLLQSWRHSRLAERRNQVIAPCVLGANYFQVYRCKMEIRDAVADDAPAACRVMRRSIVELCAADHRNDPAVVTSWLRNKTPESFLAWMTRPDNSVLVAAEEGAILAVGAVTDAGEITLNYVSPDARFRGVSRALLRALENRAAERGNARCKLTSTETARRFYHASGYVEDGPPTSKYGTWGHPMSKLLDHDPEIMLQNKEIESGSGST